MGSSLPRVPDSRQLECKKETRPLMESNEEGLGGESEQQVVDVEGSSSEMGSTATKCAANCNKCIRRTKI